MGPDHDKDLARQRIARIQAAAERERRGRDARAALGSDLSDLPKKLTSAITSKNLRELNSFNGLVSDSFAARTRDYAIKILQAYLDVLSAHNTQMGPEIRAAATAWIGTSVQKKGGCFVSNGRRGQLAWNTSTQSMELKFSSRDAGQLNSTQTIRLQSGFVGLSMAFPPILVKELGSNGLHR